MSLLASIDRLTVMYHNEVVGTLSMDSVQRRCVFQYSPQWLSDGFSISPLQLPLKNETFIAPEEPFWGNFGIFEDSLPDGYGRYLLNRMLRKHGIDESMLTPLQRLSIVGSAGMGALCYVPEIVIGQSGSVSDLDDLQNLALEVLSERRHDSEDVLYFNSGNSGGCRPKVLYSDSQGDWLVKFRHIYDPVDMGKLEWKYNLIARKCGINVPDFKLVEGKYFASKRFDIDETGNRLHVATAGAILNESIHQPKLDYKTLLHLTGYLTQDPLQVEQMFRVMVFNVFTDNKDDHPKNFSFIYQDGQWMLSPAYDLTLCASGYNGEHATSVNGNGRPTVDDMIAVGCSIRIPKKRAVEIIEQVHSSCGEILSQDYTEVVF